MADMAREAPTHEVVEYVMEFEELEVLGDRAIEWGTIRGAMRDRRTGAVEPSSYHVMRVLRRQPDGGFKVYRSIWAPRG
jgi:ketosteroid isomerase-like protein